MKQIALYEGLYAVNTKGQIWSYRNRRFLNPKGNWYLQVRLCKNGKQKAVKVHRLVAETYIEKPLNKNEVNHKNGIKTDNRVENLEWVSRSENLKHSFRHLNRIPVRGKFHPKSKKVFDSINNVIYESATEAAIKRGFNINTAKKYIQKGYHGLSYC